MSTTVAVGMATSVCPRCGTHFRCGMEAGDAECWCLSLPPLLPVPAAATAESPAPGCLCPACLQARLDQARQERRPP